MKGTPVAPRCGYSRAVMQVLEINDINIEKIATVNVLEDDEIRQAMKEYSYVGGGHGNAQY